WCRSRPRSASGPCSHGSLRKRPGPPVRLSPPGRPGLTGSPCPPRGRSAPRRPSTPAPTVPRAATAATRRSCCGSPPSTASTWIEVDMGRVEAERARLAITALPVVARAVTVALRKHPALNAWLEGDRYTIHDGVHLGIAVSLGEEGLIVPVINNAHELSAEGLAGRIKELAQRARAGQLTPDDVRGGTFTITNPGQYGSVMATPIINQPQVAILDLEAIV